MKFPSLFSVYSLIYYVLTFWAYGYGATSRLPHPHPPPPKHSTPRELHRFAVVNMASWMQKWQNTFWGGSIHENVRLNHNTCIFHSQSIFTLQDTFAFTQCFILWCLSGILSKWLQCSGCIRKSMGACFQILFLFVLGQVECHLLQTLLFFFFVS